MKAIVIFTTSVAMSAFLYASNVKQIEDCSTQAGADSAKGSLVASHSLDGAEKDILQDVYFGLSQNIKEKIANIRNNFRLNTRIK